jgi:cysteine desulfurase
VLISLIHTQNEIGTIQPTKDVERIVNQYKKAQGRIESDAPHMHVDASQSPNYIRCTKDKLGAQLITIDGSKIYGPKGVAALYVDRRVPIKPLMYGGRQESALRPGTENIPLIVGLAKALEVTESFRKDETMRMNSLRDYCIELLKKDVPKASMNGGSKHRIPNNINICIPGINAEYAVIQLSQKGILYSLMTACKSQGDEMYSYVIEEIHPKCKKSSLRFTFGRSTRKSDIRFLVESLAHMTQK